MSDSSVYLNKKKDLEALLDGLQINGGDLTYDAMNGLRRNEEMIAVMKENEKNSFNFLDTYCKEVKDDVHDIGMPIEEYNSESNRDAYIDDVDMNELKEEFKPTYIPQTIKMQIEDNSRNENSNNKVIIEDLAVSSIHNKEMYYNKMSTKDSANTSFKKVKKNVKKTHMQY